MANLPPPDGGSLQSFDPVTGTVVRIASIDTLAGSLHPLSNAQP